jgi:hypothetical protein
MFPGKDLIFVVASDDINWAKNSLKQFETYPG